MSLTIHSDPQEPAGGYAFLELPGGSLGQGPVTVAVLEVYGSRWLGPSDAGGDEGGDAGGKVAVGEANWQGGRHEFGPYDVHAYDGADWVRIGPEIVNKIEEYTPLRLSVGDQTADVTWPDDVPPRAGAAVLGGLQSTTRAVAQDAGGALVGRMADPASEPDPEPARPPRPPESVPVPEPVPEPVSVSEPDPEPSSKLWLWLLLLAVVIAAGLGAAWWFLWRDQPQEHGDDAPVVAPADTCTREALAELKGFGAMQTAIRACGDTLSADTVLVIVEDAAAQGDKDALLLFGTLYDEAALDERIETVIGLSFEDDAARAAEYYARAVSAGSKEADARLKASCARLAGLTDTLARGAFDDFCG